MPENINSVYPMIGNPRFYNLNSNHGTLETSNLHKTGEQKKMT